jgi:hypothetical protein
MEKRRYQGDIEERDGNEREKEREKGGNRDRVKREREREKRYIERNE